MLHVFHRISLAKTDKIRRRFRNNSTVEPHNHPSHGLPVDLDTEKYLVRYVSLFKETKTIQDEMANDTR